MLKSLAITHPLIADQVHLEKNNGLTGSDVTAQTRKSLHWIHKTCGYEWYQTIRLRLMQKTTCLACGGKIAVPGISDLGTTHPDIAAEMHPTLNGTLTAQQICAGWTTRVWFLGKECGHTWDTEIRVRALRGAGCRICAGNEVLADFNSMAVTAPKLAAELHPTLNKGITAKQIMANHTKSLWWQCLVSPIHVWEQTPNSRYQNNLGCPGCSGQTVFAGDKDLGTTHPEISGEWHPTLNGSLTPQRVSRGYSEQVWWHSKKCGHDWHDTVAHRVAGRGCAVCAGYQIHVGKTDLGTTHPFIAATLHPTRNAGVTAQNIHAGKSDHLWWKCDKCEHEWYQMIFLRVKGKGCEVCREKTYASVAENEIAQFVQSLGYEVQRGNRVLLSDRQEIDIYIPALRFGIEYNGLWYHSTGAGKDPGYHQNKWVQAQQAGITLVQIWEDDWQKSAAAIKARLQDHLALAGLIRYPPCDQVVGTITAAARVFLQKHGIVQNNEVAVKVGNDFGVCEIMLYAGFRADQVLPARSTYVNRVRRLFERQPLDAGLDNLIWDAGSTVYNISGKSNRT